MGHIKLVAKAMSPGTSMIRSRVFAFWRGSPLTVPRQRITVTRQTIQNRRHVEDAIRAHEAEAVLPEAAQAHLETSVDEKSLRAALRVPWPLYSTRIVCTLQCEALMSLVDVPKPSGEPPEQLRGAARPQRTKARALEFRRAYEVSELVADKTPARGTASRHPPRARGSRDLQSETHLTAATLRFTERESRVVDGNHLAQRF